MGKISDDIITRFLNNSCSDAELAAVKQWLDESDANADELFGTELLADKASNCTATTMPAAESKADSTAA